MKSIKLALASLGLLLAGRTLAQCPVITVSPSTLPNAAVGQSYAPVTFGAVPAGTYTFAAFGYPGGMTFAGGVLAGTPAAGGTFAMRVVATSGAGCLSTHLLPIHVCQAITVTDPATAAGTVNVSFSGQFTSTGGTGTVTYSTVSALPAGLTLASDGTLSGTPTQSGTFPIVVTATDAKGCTGTSPTYNLVIGCQTITVTNPAIAAGTVNASFSHSFTASNTVGTVTYTTVSALPNGLSLAANGTLSGTPTQTGTFPILVTATDAIGCSATGTAYSLVIDCQTITVTNPAIAAGTVNAPFSQAFTAGNAVGVVTYTTASPLPTGLTLAPNGTLSGTPTQVGTFPIVVNAADGNGCPGTGGTYSLVIACQTISVSPGAIPAGIANAVYPSVTFSQTGGFGAVTLSQAGALPNGLSFAVDTLSGTPTQTGSFPITITATDANSCTGSRDYLVVVSCASSAIHVSPGSLPAVTVNTAYPGTTFTAAGGTAPYAFAEAGALPAGMTFAAGTLSGTPTQTGSFPITVSATDANFCAASQDYLLVVTCTGATITVGPASLAAGLVGSAYSPVTFNGSGGIGPYSISEAGALPPGMAFDAATGTLSGTPTKNGTFPITISATDANGCNGSRAYDLVVDCQSFTVTNPANAAGTVDAPFSETFTQSGGSGSVAFSTGSTLPAGLSISPAGVLSGTPTRNGSFPITVTATDANGCTATGPTYSLVISCQPITVTDPASAGGTVNAAFSETFTQSGAHGPATFSTTSTLPAGLSLSSAGVLSGMPTQTGTFPIAVTVTDANGCTGTSAAYDLVVSCQTITVTNPGVTAGTVNASFNQSFTSSNTIGTVTYSTASALPTGLTLASNGVLSGTPTQIGTFPIVVTATDANGCSATGTAYSLVIACQAITVTNPAVTAGTVNAPFSQTFTSSNTVGTVTYSTASTLPAGLTLSPAGVLAGTPTQKGTFPIVVIAADANGCAGAGATYSLFVACQTITVAPGAIPAGTANAVYTPVTFTQAGGLGAVTFSQAGALPNGLSFAVDTLSGTPTQTGSFPITITATDANGCTGSRDYLVVVSCAASAIQVSPSSLPGVTVNTAYPGTTFSATGGTGPYTFAEVGALPAGMSFAAATLSGTPTQTGVFPITISATDAGNCAASQDYLLVVSCTGTTITVDPATIGAGTVDAAYTPVTFTGSGGTGPYTFAEAGALPAGMTFDAATATLSGTPRKSGTFALTISATDAGGCNGSTAYTLVITCQSITVTNPSNAAGTVDAPFSETFTQSGGSGTVAFSTVSTLPAGLSISPAGVLSGTPTQNGSFPISVTATDANGCTGTGAVYNLVISCQPITVTNPVTTTGTVNAAFSGTFTQSGAHGSATFSTTSTLPAGLSLSSAGVLSGMPTQTGTFPIVVTVTDANGCTGTDATYFLTISCQTISVTNPGVGTGTVNAAFIQSFASGNTVGAVTYSTVSPLPSGLTLASNGTLSGTPTQTGTFSIVVTATDANGCTGTGATYSLVINCQTITVANPANASGTVNAPFSEQFTAGNTVGTVSFSTASALPAGITLSTSGLLSGTTLAHGTFPIAVTATDANGCSRTGTPYNLVISCQTITVTNPANANGTVNAPFSETFGQAGAIGGATFSTTSTLPAGITLAPNGVLSGTPTAPGTFPVAVKVTDASGCAGTGATYTLVIACQAITAAPGVIPAATSGSLYSASFTQTGGSGAVTFSTASTLPTGITLSAAGVLSGTTAQKGAFPITVTAKDANNCTGSVTALLVVACASTPIVVSPGTLPNAAVGDTFPAQTFTASGGTGPYTFTEVGALPAGMTFSGDTLQGTPSQTGVFPITVAATDTSSCAGKQDYLLVVTCASPTITVTPASLATGTIGSAYNLAFGAGGGTGPYTWAEAGALPPGMTFDTATGTLSGTPTRAGSYSLTVSATDTAGCSGATGYTLVVNCQTITVTNPATISGTAGVTFSQTFSQSGAIGGATYSTTSTLPTGFSLDPSTGVLSGTTHQAGTFPIVVKVTDGNGCTGDGPTYALVIACQAITVANPGANAATYNGAFAATFTATGILDTVTWSESGALPAGVTLNPATGALTGTPTQTGTYPITVTATDTNGCSGSGALYTLSVAPVAVGDSYATLVDNTQAVVTGGATSSPATPFVALTGTLLANDLPSVGVSATSGTFSTSAGGSVTIAVDGTFLYTPRANVGAPATTSDSFTYTVTSNTGGTSPVTSAPATVTLTLANRVWYVRNNAGGGGLGQSQSPFNTLAAVVPASTADDIIFVYFGTGTNANQNAGVSLQNGQQLLGEKAGLTVNLHVLVATGNRPVIGNSGGAGVTVAAAAGSPRTNVLVEGLAVAGTTHAVDITSASNVQLSATVDDVVVNSAINHGVHIAAGSTASSAVTVQNCTISASQNGIDASTTAGAATLVISGDIVTAGANGIVVNGAGGGTTTITGFANNTISGITAGSGVVVTSAVFDATPGGAFQTVLAGALLIGQSGNGVGGSGMLLTNVSGDLSFSDLDVFADGGSGLAANGTAVYTGSAGFQIAVAAGVANITAVGGPAVNLATVTANLPFQTITSTNSATTGVSLDTVPGTFSAGAGSSITNATGTDFSVNAGSATVTYGGTISDTTGRLVSITNTTGGTKSFTGTISDGGSGTGGGIFLNSNPGAIVGFTGQLTLSTGTNDAFTATGGGTVTATGSANTITTTTGTALKIAGTSIGAAGVKFQSISANGAPNGIFLDNTGVSGGLTVTGNSSGFCGGQVTPAQSPDPADCTGGVIRNIAGSDGSTNGVGIFLRNTANVSLARMEINGAQNFAIRGIAVSGFSLSDSYVHGTNGTSATENEGSISFGANTGEPGGPLNGVTGAASVLRCTIQGGFEDNLRVANQSGTLNRLTVDNTTIGPNDASNGNDGILVEGESAATLDVTVQNCKLSSARATLFAFILNGNNTADLVFTANTLSNPAPYSGNSGSNGLTLISGANVLGGASTTFSITNNTFRDANGHGVLLVKSTDPGLLHGTFSGNSVGVAAVADSGSVAGSGLKVQNAGLGTVTVTVTNNRIYQYNNYGIELETGGSATLMSGAFNATITGNTVANPGTGGLPMNGIHLNGGTVPGDTYQICASVGGAGALANSITGSGANSGTDFRLRQRQNTTVRLPGYGGANNDNAAVVTFVQGQNGGATGLASNTVGSGGGGFVAGAACAQ